MKKRFSRILCVLVIMVCFFALGAVAVTFEPDSDGQYTAVLDVEPGNQYLLFVLKGKYDQTNYIEAFAEAEDSDILYFGQESSDSNGKVVFGPFVPNGYYDATLILGGSNFDEPYLAGHLSAEGVSNSASISVSGIEQTYTVKGVNSNDYVIEVDAKVLDSFGYPSVTNEEIVISLSNEEEGVSLQDNVITISRTAKEQTFVIDISAGDAKKTVYVDVQRQAAAHSYIEVYTDETMTESINEINIVGTADNYPAITVFAKTFDQYGAELDDTYSYTYADESVGATFTPVDGKASLVVSSENSLVKKNIIVNTVTRPDYKDYALVLYNLIAECEKKLSEDKNISTDGKDILPQEVWTTNTAVNEFALAVDKAKKALEAYGSDGFADGDYADEVTALTKAKNAYEASFKAGVRVDVTSIEINLKDIVMILRDTVEIEAVTDPSLPKTTDFLTWKSSDEAVVTVTPGTSGKASLKAVGSGQATITVTTRTGLTASSHITIYQKATQILISPSSVTATFGMEKTTVQAKISPKESNDVIEWTYDSEIMDLEFNEYIE
ncbi:MAG: Ig-like domain-containing protein, partial [Clostridia bacterium]|nr:Ig-like domain-containing protein [Clostridia bacterium]